MNDSLATLLADRPRISAHRPWPRIVVDEATWIAIGQQLGAGAGELISLWGDEDAVHLALRGGGLTSPHVVTTTVKDGGFPSLSRYHAPAGRLERALRDLYDHLPIGMPDGRPWLDHGVWSDVMPHAGGLPVPRREPSAYEFLPVEGDGLHQIPVGPVHAGIIEPGHFRFTANGETVARLEQRLGYTHKGIDALTRHVEIDAAARVMARVSGDSTVAYSLAFALAVEAALEIEPPPRAKILRGVMAELERVANHFGDIGAICNDASFALIHAYCGMFRERVLTAADRAFGHRLMMDRIVPGGCEETGPGAARGIILMLEEIEPQFAKIVELYDATPSLQDRTCTTGIVGRDLVTQWAAGGFVGRASGRDFDARRDHAYAPYEGAAFAVPVLTAGDVDARIWVRIKEIGESIRLLKTWLADLPSGANKIAVPTDIGPVEGLGVVEAFRGDVLVWLRIAGGRIARCHARDPSWFQWPLLEAAIEGNIVADFPLCNKSFNCSYSGHDL